MEGAMTMQLHIHHKSQFFWLRKINGVNIYECCAKCFLGAKDSRVYHATHGAIYPAYLEMDVEPSEKYIAYYLCGLSAGMKYENNTHVAFLHSPGELLQRETERIKLEISNAKWIDFESYVPNPVGEFSVAQRRCRNWIFANYINDGILQKTV